MRTAQQAGHAASAKQAIAGRCPSCGEPGLFDGVVKFSSRCPSCGLDFSSFNVGDGPAALLIFIVGTVVVVAALLLDGALSPPWWVHLVWVPVATLLTLGGLRVSKAILLLQAYTHRTARGHSPG